MKKILLILLVVISLSSTIRATETQAFYSITEKNLVRCDTNILTLDSILRINLANYVGKPVDSLLQKLPVSPHTLRFDVADNPRVVSSLVITYDNWYWVRIVVKKYRYMQPYNANKAWDIDLFRKEKVSWIFVNRGNTCVYGCESTRFRN